MNQTLNLFRMGMDATAIASQRDLSVATIYGHLARAIQNGEANLQDVIGLEENVINMLRNAIEQHEEAGRLKPVFDALGGQYDYNILRCIKATMQV